MIKRIFQLLPFCFFLSLYVPIYSKEASRAMSRSIKKTALIYIAADNNLAPYADRDIAEMMKVHDDALTTLVFLNIKRQGEQKKTQRLIIRNGTISQDGATLYGSQALDSGDPTTFLEALRWSQSYPSSQLLVDIWDHGSGSLNRNVVKHRGCCWDDTTGHYMTDLDYKWALETFVQTDRRGRRIDILAFDCCLMADIEVAYTVAPYTRYMVSSQDNVPGDGFNYATMLAPVNARDVETKSKFAMFSNYVSPKSWAMWMVDSYNANYGPLGYSYTLSTIDEYRLGAVVSTNNSVAQELIRLLKTSSRAAIKNAIKSAVNSNNTLHFDEPVYVDLYCLYSSLLARISAMSLSQTDANILREALIDGQHAIDRAVIKNAVSSHFAKARGISIYFPNEYYGIEPSYFKLDWSEKTSWLAFLQEYLA
jgi:hypothetical protein